MPKWNKWNKFHAENRLQTTHDPEGDELHEQNTIDPHGDELSEQFDDMNKIGTNREPAKAAEEQAKEEQTAPTPFKTKPTPY